MAIGNMATGRVFYKTVKVGGNTYYIGDYVFDINDLSNEVINNIENFEIQFVSDTTISISFDPIDNEELLDAVENNETIMRLQLLIHQPSNSIRGKIEYGAYVKRPFEFDADAFPSNHPDLPKLFVRSHSNNRSFYGRTWLNLTREELEQGYAELNNVIGILSQPLCQLECPDEETGKPNTRRIAVELYCPCLKRSGKDVWFYERNGNYKASNILTYIGE